MAQKDFQQLILTAAEPSGSLVSDPGYIVISGVFDSAGVTISLTDDPNNTPISIPVVEPVAFINPVTAANAFYVPAHRLTFTAAGGLGAENIVVRWMPTHFPY